MKVRIEKLNPMRVASACVISMHPEIEAWEKIRAWAEPLGLLDDLERHPVFGFNNPGPLSDQEAYGYEFWIQIEEDVPVPGEIRQKDFEGGTYAVTRHKGFPNPQVWKQLWDWVQSSPYKWRQTHELERPLDPRAPESEMAFDLYLPIE